MASSRGISTSVPAPAVQRGAGTLWLLRLVPDVPHGRWWCGGVTLAVLLGVYTVTGVFGGALGSGSASAALFFCVILAYVTPVFHYITWRTERAFDELGPHLGLSDERLAAMRQGITIKSRLWLVVNALIAVAFWTAQSWLLAGSFSVMTRSLHHSVASFVMAIGPLLVWLFLTCAMYALTDNARLFRRLTRHVSVDLLDTRNLMPFGRMAVSSTLMVIGAQAAFPLMWLGSETNPWTTIPGLIGTSLPLVFLFVAPVWPIHVALRTAKRNELERVQGLIGRARREGPAPSGAFEALAPLLTYRREVISTSEWPFDLSIVARLGLYLVVVPLTWIGAALIENVVQFVIDSGP